MLGAGMAGLRVGRWELRWRLAWATGFTEQATQLLDSSDPALLC